MFSAGNLLFTSSDTYVVATFFFTHSWLTLYCTSKTSRQNLMSYIPPDRIITCPFIESLPLKRNVIRNVFNDPWYGVRPTILYDTCSTCCLVRGASVRSLRKINSPVNRSIGYVRVELRPVICRVTGRRRVVKGRPTESRWLCYRRRTAGAAVPGLGGKSVGRRVWSRRRHRQPRLRAPRLKVKRLLQLRFDFDSISIRLVKCTQVYSVGLSPNSEYSQPFHRQVTTLGKLFTHMCPCHQAV